MDRPQPPQWPPAQLPRPVEQRVRHVWLLPGWGGAPRQGLVLEWRRVRSGQAWVWQALVFSVSDRLGDARVEWAYLESLRPVRSTPPTT